MRMDEFKLRIQDVPDEKIHRMLSKSDHDLPKSIREIILAEAKRRAFKASSLPSGLSAASSSPSSVSSGSIPITIIPLEEENKEEQKISEVMVEVASEENHLKETAEIKESALKSPLRVGQNKTASREAKFYPPVPRKNWASLWDKFRDLSEGKGVVLVIAGALLLLLSRALFSDDSD